MNKTNKICTKIEYIYSIFIISKFSGADGYSG